MFRNSRHRKPNFLGGGRSWQSTFMVAAFLAYGCTSQSAGTVKDPLSGLPTLPSAIDLDLRENLPRYETAEATKKCTPDEIEFDRLSLILMAVYYSEDIAEAPPWTISERNRVVTLRERWEALGGDDRTVSQACISALDGWSK